MPPYSCATPGRNPGTSTKVRIGISKLSQKRMKRAAFLLALISRQPASTSGWLATTPTVWPSSRMKPQRILPAWFFWISRKSPSSATVVITSRMS
ncbi:hypothetical protein D3C87_1832640 [compost metagenome]